MAAACQQPHILIPPDRLADAEFHRCIEMISHFVSFRYDFSSDVSR
jgi:hypothetical protein